MSNAAAEVQALLRFLTKDARLPLAEAMPKIHGLRKLDLNTPQKIAEAAHSDLKVVFTDEKVLKTTVMAAKRVSNPKKKQSSTSKPTSKQSGYTRDAAFDEAALTLPETEATEDRLREVVIETNRAPLFLAFTLAIMEYTHPEQPLSSKLSLAQAVVSAGAQSKAKSIGLTSGPTAEEDGWMQGQPKIRVMGREIAVMRRQQATAPEISEDTTNTDSVTHSTHEAFWGIDLEALRKSNGPLIAGKNSKHNGPPIHTSQSARSYLLRSMDIINPEPVEASPKKKKVTSAEIAARKEEAAAMVMKTIGIVLESWKHTLTRDELDRRTQSWYALVRPDVAQGQAGWGQRGQLPLRNILDLKRDP